MFILRPSIAPARRVGRAVASILLLALLSPGPLAAQGLITARPETVTLRTIWTMISPYRESYVGRWLTGLGDINGDGLADFAVGSGAAPRWRVFFGDRPRPKVTPAFAIQHDGVLNVRAGRFFGPDSLALVFLVNADNYDRGDYGVYPLRDGRPAATPSSSWRTWVGRKEYPDTNWRVDDCAVADLDGDGDDELILFVGSIQTLNVLRPRAEIRIHKGGPAFTLERPSITLVDEHVPTGGYGRTLAVTDLDGDRRPDIAASQIEIGRGWHLLLYWGGDWSDGERGFDREIAIDWSRFVVADSDGDGVKDIVSSRFAFFLSGGGNSARTRGFRHADADLVHTGSPVREEDNMHAAGYLNDRRFEGIMMRSVTPARRESIELISGGPLGADSTFEGRVVISESAGQRGLPIGDCNGDGWEDYLGGGGFTSSAAYVVAGGPYIPRDAAMGAVRDAGGERSDAFSVWPQPARDVVNVAWRGDLRSWPRTILVHDIGGRVVARGEIEAGAPAVQWDCSLAPRGSYLLTLLDAGGAVIATTTILTQ